MIQKQTRVQIIFEVHLQHAAVFVNPEKLATDCLLLVLIGAGLPLALLAHHILRLHSQCFGNDCKGLRQAFSSSTLIHRFRGRILLHVHPPLIDIDRQRKLRHIGIVEAVATNALLSCPLPNGLHVLLEAIAQHGRAFLIGNPRGDLTGNIRGPRCHGAHFIYLEQQQLGGQLAVEKPVLFVTSQSDGLAEFRGSGKYTEAPAWNAAFNRVAQCLVQAAQLPALTQPLTVRGIGEDQPLIRPVAFQCQGIDCASLNVHNILQTCPLDVFPGGPDDPAILVKARHSRDPPLLALVGATLRLLAQR